LNFKIGNYLCEAEGHCVLFTRYLFEIHLNNITVLNCWLFVNIYTFEKRWPRAVDEFVNLVEFGEC
jgi:hypothetical protein